MLRTTQAEWESTDMCGDGPLKWSERTYAQGFMTSSQVDGEIVHTIEPPINPRDLGRISWLDVGLRRTGKHKAAFVVR